MVRKLAYLVVAISWFVVVPSVASAAEPIFDFLDALTERGHHDVALIYLDRMSSSRLAPVDFKDELDYRRGLLLADLTRRQANPTLRQQRLGEAEEAFERFLDARPSHQLAPLARGQLGNLRVERARSLLTRAAEDTTNRQTLEQQAREIFAEAHTYLLQSQEDIARQLRPLNARRDREVAEQRDALRAQYVQTKLAAARVLFEQADILQDDQQQFEQKLTEAAAAFEEVAQKYRNWSAGLYAVLFEGECYQRLGEHQRALTYFAELLQNKDNSPPVRRLKTKALTLSIKSWLHDKQNGHNRAIEMTKKWLALTRGSEDEDSAWAELRLGLARAYQQRSTKANKDIEAARALSEARKHAEEVARIRGPFQKEAQQLLVALGRGDDQQVTNVDPEAAANFAQARDAAKQALDEMKYAEAATKILQSQLNKIADPTTRDEIIQRLEASRDKAAELAQQAKKLFERAANLATPADRHDLNSVRYYLAYLYYSQGQYRHAAVLASFVATHYPDSVAARECASVALASHQHIYQQLDATNRQAQAARIARIAELMISKWPGQSQANAALTTLLDVSVQQGDLENAERYLAKIPPDSPRRAAAELRTGQALWRAYLKGAAAQQAGQPTRAADQLERLKSRAQQMLAQGIAHVRQEPPNESTLRSALSLAQIHLDLGQPEEALGLLDDAVFGAITLIDRGDPLASSIPGFAVEAYKTAIRAHVNAAASSSDTEASINAARGALDELRTRLSSQPDGQQKLISIYVGLARDLERQLTVASPQTRRALSIGFETFLRSAAGATADVSVLNWVAETFYRLGRSFQQNKDSDQARRYFSEASASYEKILKLERQQPGQVSPKALIQVRVRQAITSAALGRFPQAVELFAQVLGQREAILNIQVEAARVLQAWGDSGNPQGYLKAIGGDRPNSSGRNVIWGWGRLASAVARTDLLAKNASYRETLYEARYNIALCRYKYGLAKPTTKQESLQRAKHDISVTHQLYDLDRSRKKQYETLIKAIQRDLGEKAIGLPPRGVK